MTPFETPIVSIRDDVADDETFGVFLLELGEGIDWIQEAEISGDLAEVAKRCDALERDARRYGLPPLAEAAQRVREAADGEEREPLREALVALTDVARRVRLASTAI